MRANRCSPPGRRHVSHSILCPFDAVQSCTLATEQPQPPCSCKPPRRPPCGKKRGYKLQQVWCSVMTGFLPVLLPLFAVAHSPPRVLIASPSTCVLLCFGEISAGNCESFTSCSHNGLWDYAKHSASAALPIDWRQQHPLERTGKRWRALNEDVTAITQVRLTDTLAVCLSSPLPPSPLFKKFLFDTLLKCSLISCSSFIMHVHFKFAWIYFPDASAANLTYNDVYCTVSTIVLWFNQGDSLHLWLYFSIYTLVIRGDGGEAGVKCFPQRGAFIAPQWCWGEEELSDVDGTASGTDWLMLNSQQCLMHCLQHRKKHQKQLAFKNALNQHVTHKKKKVWHL